MKIDSDLEPKGWEERIAEYVSRTVSITPEEATVFCAAFREVKIRKRQFIVQPNFVARHRNYVLQGAFGLMWWTIKVGIIQLHLQLMIGGLQITIVISYSSLPPCL